MALSFWQFLIVCPLVFLAGFVDAVAGGGGLISLPAYLFAGLPATMAVGTNKLSSSIGTTLATYRYARKGYIPWKQAFFCVISAFIGSFIGAKLKLLIDEGAFKLIMLVVLPLTAAYVFFGKGLRQETACEPYSFVKTTLIGVAASLVIGAYDGFYGPGTGTFLILLLTGVAHMEVAKANGVSKAINLSTNVAALYVYITSGNVLFILGLVAGVFSLAGNYIGTRFFAAKGMKSVRLIVMVVIAIFFVKLLLEVLGAM